MNSMNDAEGGDSVIIEELRIPARMGVYAEEKRRVQTICLSLEFGLPTQACFRSDDVADTIDYALVAERLRRLAVSRHFNLVEYLAEQVARLVIEEFGALWIRVRARKIGVVPGAAYVGTAITRVNVKSFGLTERDGRTERASAALG
jgi:dihydroneopterin aldolase